jgi:hypothetical protein
MQLIDAQLCMRLSYTNKLHTASDAEHPIALHDVMFHERHLLCGVSTSSQARLLPCDYASWNVMTVLWHAYKSINPLCARDSGNTTRTYKDRGVCTICNV